MSDKTKSAVKQKRLQEQEAAAKKKKATRIKAIVFFIAFIVIAAVVVVFTSEGFYRTAIAVDVNGVKWTVADYNFQYSTQVNLIIENLSAIEGDTENSKLPDTSKSLKKQIFNEETGETWHDYFTKVTDDMLKEVSMLYQMATAEGKTLGEDDALTIENEISNLEIYAGMYGMEADAFVTMQYGKGVNTEVYRKNMERIYIAEKYAVEKGTSLEYEDSALDAYYAENADDLDVFEYRSFYIASEGSDGMAAAEEKANEFAGKITDESSFAELCREYADESNKERYELDSASKSSTSGKSLAETYKEWMLDENRKAGDVTVIKGGNGYYVVYFVERNNNQYNSVKVDFTIHQLPENSEADVSDVEAEAKKALDAMVKGDSIDDVRESCGEYLYQGGSGEGASHATFADDRINTWLFEEEREIGDSEMFEVAEGLFYVVRYSGEDELCSRLMAKNELVRVDYQAWLDEAIADYTVKTTLLKGLAQ